MFTQFDRPVYDREGTITVQAYREDLGWVPYTILNNSGEEEMQQAWDTVTSEFDVAPFEVEPLEDRRFRASRTRGEFAFGLYKVGIVDPSQSLAIASGSWPEEFDYVLMNLSEEDKLLSKIKLSDNLTVYRTDNLVLQIANNMEISAEDLDTIFEVESG